VSTIEKHSPNWEEGRRKFEQEPCSFRSLGSILGVSQTAVAKRARKEGWIRYQADDPSCKPTRKPVLDHRSTLEETPIAVRGPRTLAGASQTDLTKRGRNLILDLMAELQFLNRSHQTLVEIVEAHVSGEKDTLTRFKLIRSLDHQTRVKTVNNLATALAKLNDAASGKKRQAEDTAKSAGHNSEWGDDLE
jgi:hypothetical protein